MGKMFCERNVEICIYGVVVRGIGISIVNVSA